MPLCNLSHYLPHTQPTIPDRFQPLPAVSNHPQPQAKELQTKNVSYIVKNEEIIIVDEFTGRTMPGRRWSDGLHQVKPFCMLVVNCGVAASGRLNILLPSVCLLGQHHAGQAMEGWAVSGEQNALIPA